MHRDSLPSWQPSFSAVSIGKGNELRSRMFRIKYIAGEPKAQRDKKAILSGNTLIMLHTDYHVFMKRRWNSYAMVE